MLDLHRLRDQIDAFESHEAGIRERRARQRQRAEAILSACNSCWQKVQTAVEAAQPRRLVAALREPPALRHPPRPRPTPITVVATDGSQIYPERHIDPLFFVLNVSRVACQYGTHEEPVLDSIPRLRVEDDLADSLRDLLPSMATELVSALRDEMELKHLLETARSNRVEGRPLVALADGTLIRWMIRGLNDEAAEAAMIARYTNRLDAFRTEGLPLASYVSMPATTEVVNGLRFVVGELDVPAPTLDVSLPEGLPLDGLLDRHLFRAHLEPGERSATYGSTSHIQAAYPAGTEISYFYLYVPPDSGTGEIARVEVPRWVAEDEPLLDRVHATVLQECKKGDGYPLMLSEAHEQAVIRAPERESFFHLVERRLRRAGLAPTGSRKRRSKQRPRI